MFQTFTESTHSLSHSHVCLSVCHTSHTCSHIHTSVCPSRNRPSELNKHNQCSSGQTNMVPKTALSALDAAGKLYSQAIQRNLWGGGMNYMHIFIDDHIKQQTTQRLSIHESQHYALHNRVGHPYCQAYRNYSMGEQCPSDQMQGQQLTRLAIANHDQELYTLIVPSPVEDLWLYHSLSGYKHDSWSTLTRLRVPLPLIVCLRVFQYFLSL